MDFIRQKQRIMISNSSTYTNVVNCRAGRSRSDRPRQRDFNHGPVSSSSSITTHHKNRECNEISSNEAPTIAFPNVAMYESSCNDVVYIKSQLLELRTLINACLPI
ncbi:unnamed protein product [Thelazia callipaeda]|uniref:Uncharacterized protein n=1 Tax=Thelazia callipaeda TaxID=103827 RepID=A0A0N5CUL4_THECL|nr:unnamed protein product [Thelazia callipaeda]